MKGEEIFVVGKVHLNPVGDDKIPLIEIVLDTASGRAEGEIILLRQITKEDGEYYVKKLPDRRHKK